MKFDPRDQFIISNTTKQLGDILLILKDVRSLLISPYPKDLDVTFEEFELFQMTNAQGEIMKISKEKLCERLFAK